MRETQSYKVDTSVTENALAAIAGAVCIAMPVVCWLLGYVPTWG